MSHTGDTGWWAPDPSGRHEYRWWDGSAWTDQVADRGVQGVDPLPPYPGAAGVGGVPLATAGPAGAPPGAVWSDPTAVLGRRYGAFFIDLAVAAVAFAILFAVTAEQRSVAEMLEIPGCRLQAGSDQVECDNRAVVQLDDTVYEAGGGFALAGIAFSFLYYGVLQGLTGATLGKLMTGIRVVRADGALPGAGRAIVRWLVFAVDGPLTLYLCGIITTAVSRGHRRLGDRAAGTYVVVAGAAGQPVALP
jgi:uncharacterized RDD family membrane protein YckC